MSQAAPRLDGQVVLAVFAHPDDESLACGGTLAKLAAAGARVVVMCASHGERGSDIGPVRNDALGRERAVEMREAAEALGVAELRLLSHPDGDLRWAAVTDFNADIVLFLRRHPQASVITFGEDGLYWHADHIGVYERVLTAVTSLGTVAPPKPPDNMASKPIPLVSVQKGKPLILCRVCLGLLIKQWRSKLMRHCCAKLPILRAANIIVRPITSDCAKYMPKLTN